MDESTKWFLKTKAGREFLIEKILEATPKEKNWQSFHTPYDLCEKMILKTDVKGKSILVLFNIEFVKVLIEKFGVHSNNITFLADCRLESEMATKTFHVNNKVVHNIEDIQEELKNMGKQFDLCFSNPPYAGKTHIDIVSNLYKICNELIIIQPENWALDTKNVNKSWSDFKDQISGYVKSIELFAANKLFGIATYSKIGITHINKQHIGDMEINYYGEIFVVNSFEEVTKFASKLTLIKTDFINKILKYLNDDPQNKLINHIEDEYDQSDKNLCQIAQIIGTPTYDELNERSDFYTLVTKDPLNCIGFRKKHMHTFKFDSFRKCENFVKFLSTKVARFCLAIYKIDMNVGKNELQLIPWMDFNEEWDDQKLYNYFQISNEIQDYISLFIPDFHELHKE